MRARKTAFRAVGLLIAGLPLLSGCFSVIGLQPTVVTTTEPVAVSVLCEEPEGALACVENRQPSLRFELAVDEEVIWFKVSPDGRTAILSTAPRGHEVMRWWQVTFIALDLEERQELWRLKLSPDLVGQAEDCYFIGADMIGFWTTSGELVAVDRVSGAERWRITGSPELPGDWIQLVLFDAEHGFFVLSGFRAHYVVDAATGRVVSKSLRSASDDPPQVVGGRPWVTDQDIYLYDSGILRLPRDEREVAWQSRFVTMAEDDKTGANVGMAILGALFGTYSSLPPDLYVGRTVEPVMVGDWLVAGAMGVVHGIDPATGAIHWSADLAVPAIATIEPYHDRILVLAGGYSVRWRGNGEGGVERPERHGLYCLRVQDGTAVDSFQSPFNRNLVDRTLDASLRSEYDRDDAWEREEDWFKQDTRARSDGTAGAQLAHSTTRLTDACLIERGLLVATDSDVVLLDAESGAEIRGYTLEGIGELRSLGLAGQWVVVRAAAGVAVVDATTGEVVWSTQIAPPEEWRWFLDAGCEPRTNVPASSFFVSVELQYFFDSLYWADGTTGLVLVPTAGPSLLGLRLADGEAVFELPVGFHTRVVHQDGQLVIHSQEGSIVNIYRVPRGV